MKKNALLKKGCTVCVDVCPLDLLAIDLLKGKAYMKYDRVLVLPAMRSGLPNPGHPCRYPLSAALRRTACCLQRMP